MFGAKARPAKPKARKVVRKILVSTAAPVAKLSKPVAAAVKRIVKRKQETKYVTRLVENNIAHNSPIGSGDFARVFPVIPSGTADTQRIGDKISPVKCTLKGTVAISRSDTLAQRNSALMVRLVVLQLKATRKYPAAQTAWTNGMFNSLLKRNDDVTGTENVAFQGNQNELFYPINRDDFDVLGERFIKLSSLNAAGMSTGNSVEAAPINAIAKNFNIRLKHVPATVRYDAGADNDPAAFAPFLAVGYAYMDGAGPDAADFRIICSAQSHLYYKDA